MRRYISTIRPQHMIGLASLAVFAMCIPTSSYGQSGTKQDSQAAGSSTKQMQPAMEGYCPVCVNDKQQMVKAGFSSVFDGKTYFFAGQKEKTSFDANPAKYVPALGGDCVVAYKKMGKRVPGDVHHWASHNNRLYLFSNEMAKNEFNANPEAFADVDLAFDGLCSVCKVEMKQDIAGKPELGVIYGGMRYYFPAKEQRDMFIANPVKYAIPNPAAQADGSGTKPAQGSGSAKR